MPNTITFIPHRMRKRFARINSSKMSELASLMWRGADSQEREMLNFAGMGDTSTHSEAGMELQKEHHSRAAGLNQRLAAAELDDCDHRSHRSPVAHFATTHAGTCLAASSPQLVKATLLQHLVTGSLKERSEVLLSVFAGSGVSATPHRLWPGAQWPVSVHERKKNV